METRIVERPEKRPEATLRLHIQPRSAVASDAHLDEESQALRTANARRQDAANARRQDAATLWLEGYGSFFFVSTIEEEGAFRDAADARDLAFSIFAACAEHQH